MLAAGAVNAQVLDLVQALDEVHVRGVRVLIGAVLHEAKLVSRGMGQPPQASAG